MYIILYIYIYNYIYIYIYIYVYIYIYIVYNYIYILYSCVTDALYMYMWLRKLHHSRGNDATLARSINGVWSIIEHMLRYQTTDQQKEISLHCGSWLV